MTNGKSKITAAALMMAFLFSFLSCQPSDDDDTAPNCGADGECRLECATDPDCTGCRDLDGDGYGLNCAAGYDCDDGIETGAGCHKDCFSLFADADGDGYGAGERNTLCFFPPGFTEQFGDCDDSPETGAGCHSECLTSYVDADSDGFGVGKGSIVCTVRPGYADNDGDCDENDPDISPGAVEMCDNLIDNDCDGLRTQIDPDCCADNDGDWYRVGPGCMGEQDCDDNDPNNGRSCGKCRDRDGDGYYSGCDFYQTLQGPDCDDYDPNNQQNCPLCEDNDYDGVYSGCDLYLSIPGPDCDDENPWNQFDCDTCVDLDFDGRGAECDLGPDCDDADTMTYDGAPEYPGDGVDNDCAGDGDMMPSDENGIFISISTGEDSNPGTMTEPVSTVTRGIELAEASGLGAVFVAAGVYEEVLKAKVSVFGGYNPDDWTRDIAKYRPTIGGYMYGPHRVGVYRAATDVIVDGVLLFGAVLFSPIEQTPSMVAPNGPRPVISNSIIDYDRYHYWASIENLESNLLLFNNIIVSKYYPTVIGVGYFFWRNNKSFLANNLLISIPLDSKGWTGVSFWGGNTSELILINNILSSKYGSGALVGSGGFVMSTNLFDVNKGSYFRGDEWRGAEELNSCIDSGCIEARGNIAASSYYADPIGGDYSVNATSPTIDAGVDPADYFLHLERYTPGPIDGDGDGVPQWDIGPVEYTP